jgi:hypothetical protein
MFLAWADEGFVKPSNSFSGGTPKLLQKNLKLRWRSLAALVALHKSAFWR